MKKTLKISALALALVMVLGMAMAFAAVSVTGPITVDNSGTPVDTSAPISDTIANADEAAAVPEQTETAATLQVLWNGDIPATEANKTLTFSIPGVADGTKIYLYHLPTGATAWKVEGNATASGGKVNFTMPSTMSPFALVASTATPVATGDNANIALWGGLMVAAVAVAAGTVVYSRKRKNEA